MTTRADSAKTPDESSPLSDEEVVRRVRKGETSLFEIIMRRYNQRLFRVARAILGNDDEAEDVMQQAYVNAYKQLHQFQGRARFGTWLTQIAVNEALARSRRRGRLEELDAMPELDERAINVLSSKALTPEEEAMRRELREALENSFDSIPEIYRYVFILREVEGLSTAEAAECLGLSEDTVKTRLHRARALLRQELFERAGVVTSELFPLHLTRCDRVVAAVYRDLGLPGPATPHCVCPGEFCRTGVSESATLPGDGEHPP